VSGTNTGDQNLASVLGLGNSANSQIKNVADPTDAQDAATKAYVDALIIKIGDTQKLLAAGFSVSDLLNGGHSVADLLADGVSLYDLFEAGAPLVELLSAIDGIGDLLAAGVTVSELLDKGVTASGFIGIKYQGGIIFYVDATDGSGLVCALTDQGAASAGWGCKGTSIGTTQTSIGTGDQNTTDIEAGCATTGTAADMCANLTSNSYSD
jgi:hypothetical protein